MLTSLVSTARQNWQSPPVPVLMYHRVSPDHTSNSAEHADVLDGMLTTPDSFARQMGWLARNGYQSLSLDDLLDARYGHRSLPSRSVVITFDDGYQDIVEHAVPVLMRYGFTAHIFLVSSMVGRMAEWDREEFGWSFPLFDWETARWLESKGFHCDAHTTSHRPLATLDAKETLREIEECRYVLKQELGRDSTHFAYPYGSYNEETKEIVKQAGFRSACSVRRGLSPASDDPFALRRICIHTSDNLLDFKCAVLTGVPARGAVVRRLRRIRKHR